MFLTHFDSVWSTRRSLRHWIRQIWLSYSSKDSFSSELTTLRNQAYKTLVNDRNLQHQPTNRCTPIVCPLICARAFSSMSSVSNLPAWSTSPVNLFFSLTVRENIGSKEKKKKMYTFCTWCVSYIFLFAYLNNLIQLLPAYETWEMEQRQSVRQRCTCRDG